MVRGGQLGVDDFLRILDGLRGEQERAVVDVMLRALNEIDDGIADDSLRPALATWVGNYLRPLGRQLGWTPRRGESDDRKLMRRALLGRLGAVADDHDTLAQAERWARMYLHDPHTVDPDVAGVAVPLASRHAHADRLDAIVAMLPHAPSATDRVVLDTALGRFLDPALLRRALDATLTDAVRTQDVLRVIFGATSDPVRRPIVAAWVQEHFDAIRARLPGEAPGRLTGLVSGVCTADEISAGESFWHARVSEFEGADRTLREALESADQCVAARQRNRQALTTFLSPAARRRH